jgi:hypothetical protein
LEYEKNNTVTWYGIVLRMDEDRIWQTILNTEVNENSQTLLILGWEPVKKAVTQKHGRIWEDIETEELWKGKDTWLLKGTKERGNGDRW